MTKYVWIFICSVLLSLTSKSQTNVSIERECRLTGGLGSAGSTKSPKSAGLYSWLQLDYKFYKNISIATEFENMSYTMKSSYTALPSHLSGINSVDNNFSLLFKYHIRTKSPLKVAVGSGGTYTIRTSEYYIYESDSTSQRWYRNVSSFDDFQIPLLLEIEYPLWKTINIQARARYNLNSQNGSTYSSGLGLSVKL